MFETRMNILRAEMGEKASTSLLLPMTTMYITSQATTTTCTWNLAVRPY